MRQNNMGPVEVEKLIFGGQALTHDQGKTVFLWGALPGEIAEYEILKKRKGIVEGMATKIITRSPNRIEPREDHYICCSPWQILSEAAENNWKQTIALETYKKIGGFNIAPETCPIFSLPPSFGYRNKIEFSFLTLPGNTLSLAFFNRGTHALAPLPGGCALAPECINKTGEKIRVWLASEAVPGTIAKSLIIRANEKGETIAALFIKEVRQFGEYPALDETLKGFKIYFSNPLSPAATPDELLYTAGAEALEVNISDVRLSFGPLSFFQVNPPVFALALNDIAAHSAGSAEILDYYAGVGAIGLALAKTGRPIKLIEINSEAHNFAQKNIAANNLKNAEALLLPVERAFDYIKKDSIVIVDPPRAGLHPQFVARLLEALPLKIIYLSCDLATQARDLKLLSVKYGPVFHSLYNFFPRTPHIEALAVLELRP